MIKGAAAVPFYVGAAKRRQPRGVDVCGYDGLIPARSLLACSKCLVLIKVFTGYCDGDSTFGFLQLLCRAHAPSVVRAQRLFKS